MTEVDQRAVLERLIREKGEDYAGLSRILGRNPAYIQQFIKRGIPRKLDEADRRALARYFSVSESVLGGPVISSQAGDLVRVAKLDVGAAAGHGAFNEAELAAAHVAFDPRWLRQLTGGRAEDLSLIRVQGDSMSPTLTDGDDILVDRSDGVERVRDGIYVLRREDALMVKRLAVTPLAGQITVKSDNPAYPEWADCQLSSIAVIGRVIWAGRKVN